MNSSLSSLRSGPSATLPSLSSQLGKLIYDFIQTPNDELANELFDEFYSLALEESRLKNKQLKNRETIRYILEKVRASVLEEELTRN